MNEKEGQFFSQWIQPVGIFDPITPAKVPDHHKLQFIYTYLKTLFRSKLYCLCAGA